MNRRFLHSRCEFAIRDGQAAVVSYRHGINCHKPSNLTLDLVNQCRWRAAGVCGTHNMCKTYAREAAERGQPVVASG